MTKQKDRKEIKVVKLTFMGKPPEQVYVIRQFDGLSSMGAIWKELERGTLDQMTKSFSSKKYTMCKKYTELM